MVQCDGQHTVRHDETARLQTTTIRILTCLWMLNMMKNASNSTASLWRSGLHGSKSPCNTKLDMTSQCYAKSLSNWAPLAISLEPKAIRNGYWCKWAEPDWSSWHNLERKQIYLLLLLQTSSGAEAVQTSTAKCCKYVFTRSCWLTCAQVYKIAMSLQWLGALTPLLLLQRATSQCTVALSWRSSWSLGPQSVPHQLKKSEQHLNFWQHDFPNL